MAWPAWPLAPLTNPPPVVRCIKALHTTKEEERRKRSRMEREREQPLKQQEMDESGRVPALSSSEPHPWPGGPRHQDPTWLIDNTIAYRQPCAAQKFLELCRAMNWREARLRLRLRLGRATGKHWTGTWSIPRRQQPALHHGRPGPQTAPGLQEVQGEKGPAFGGEEPQGLYLFQPGQARETGGAFP